MRLVAVIVADAAAQSGGKLSILGAWLTRFTPPRFPWSEPITVVVRVFVDDDDNDRPHTVSIVFRGPVGGLLIPTEFHIEPGQIEQMLGDPLDEEQRAVTFVATQLGMQFTGPGVLKIVISIDGESVCEYPVVIAEPASGT
jgi:hypothetical protein